jgi:hypothetical protein
VQTLEQVRARIASYMGAWASDDLGRHAVIVKAGQAFIGQVHLNGYVNSYARWNDEKDPPFNPLEVELAFAFGRRFWGQGYAFEACQAVIRYAFDDLQLRRLVGGAALENERWVGVLDKGSTIENRVHWVLDVTFYEDASRIRTGDAPQNMGVLRHIALNLLRQEPSKGSLKTKRFRAALNDDYLATVLGL